MRWCVVVLVAALCVQVGPRLAAQTKPAAKPASPAAKPAAPRPMTNADVMKMVTATLSDDLIINSIRQAPRRNFDLSVDGLLALKQAKVSDAVIRVMQSPDSVSAPAPEATKPAVALPPPPAPPTAAPATVKIQDGTAVSLIVSEEISSATAKSNDVVRLELAEDIKVGDVVVVPKSSAAVGRVLTAKPRGRMGKGGTLEFSVDYIKIPDGSNLRLRATTGQGDNRVITGAMLLGVGSLFVKGKEVVFPKGTTVNAFVDGDKDVVLPVKIVSSRGSESGLPNTNQESPAGQRVGNSASTSLSEPGTLGKDSIPVVVRDGETAMFQSRLAAQDAVGKVKTFFDAKNVDYTLNADTNRVNTDWYGNRRCGPGIQHCENKASIRVSSEVSQTIVRVQVFERKREGGLSPKPWNENSKNKGKETSELAVELQRALSR